MVLPLIREFYGPLLVGTVLNFLLYGITITQLYLYHISSNRDRIWIRAFVYLLFVGDTVHTLFTLLYMYETLIDHFGDTTHLETANWVFATGPALTGILGGLVQAFFAWRIKVLTAGRKITIIILFCATSSFLMGVATATAAGIVPQFDEFPKFRVTVILWLGCSSLADVLITGTLVFYLKNHKTGFIRTDTYIDRVIRLTVQTGLITAIWAFVDLMLFLLSPTGLHLLFNTPLSKLYTNSLMSSLNARKFWWHDNEGDDALAISSQSILFKLSQVKSHPTVTDRNQDTEVFVHVESHQAGDLPKIGHDVCPETPGVAITSRSHDKDHQQLEVTPSHHSASDSNPKSQSAAGKYIVHKVNF
ncbi:hypothetical protein E4T56_gene10751 [Termitomyces sp. T112]|nr:hypothetical protein E4T56_gene10751 [Termitomyces sp. T112]